MIYNNSLGMTFCELIKYKFKKQVYLLSTFCIFAVVTCDFLVGGESILGPIPRGAIQAEPEFVHLYGAQESSPRYRFRQAGNRFLGSL
jgi:hypothetical protein